MREQWEATDGDRTARVTVPGRPSVFAGADTVEYRTLLPDPRDPGEDVAVLVFRGLYAHATVSVPGRLDGDGPVEHDAYFEPLRIPFVPDGETEIRLRCEAPDDRFGGIHDTAHVPSERSVPGVWWDVSVETGSFPYVESLRVRPGETDDSGRTTLHVTASVLTGEPTEGRLTYSVRPAGGSRGGGAMQRGRFEASGAGRTTVEHEIEARDVARWWPRGHGDQHRHVLRGKIEDCDRTRTFGRRTVAFEDGRVLVNGERVPIRGVTLLDGDPGDIERALEVNASLVRARANVPPRVLYEACDEAGLLVWQDLPLTGPGAFDTERGRELAARLRTHTAAHPSVALYTAHDEPREVASGLGEGLLARLRLRWRAFRASYDGDAARELADVLPEPTVPAVGGPGLGCGAGAYYPGRRYGRPADMEWLLERYPVAVLGACGEPGPDGIGGEESRAALLETTAETLRRASVGGVVHTLSDVSEDGPGVYAPDGSPKAGRDALAASFEPVGLFLDDGSDERPVVGVNDYPHTVEATLGWRSDGTEGQRGVRLEPGINELGVVPAGEQVDLELAGDGIHLTRQF